MPFKLKVVRSPLIKYRIYDFGKLTTLLEKIMNVGGLEFDCVMYRNLILRPEYNGGGCKIVISVNHRFRADVETLVFQIS